MTNIEKELVPPQHTGAESNTEETVTLSGEAQAVQLYEIAKQRLLDVNNWEKLCGPGSADFKLTDMEGNDVQRTAEQHDHFKIDIPGPGTVTGEGFDWVKIESIEEQSLNNGEAAVVMRVRPATNPKGGGNDVAHFFSDDATSNFIVKLHGNTVTAAVYGRNELPNTKAEHAIDKARNTMVALSAVAGVSKLQWKSLVKGMVSL
jgi:hypothetical protein